MFSDLRDHLTHLKSKAWMDPDVVAWYSQQMSDERGINRLKYRVEQDILAAHVRGGTLLDVGIGTGRGSLPFARHGLSVTGVDSSHAMLVECRRLAGEVPIRLLHGDANQLPAADDEYDTVMSLNLMVHLPRWREILIEWARVVKPGGRVIFDINSLDHFNLVSGRKDHFEDLIPKRADSEAYTAFMLALSSRDIIEFADDRGLAVVDLIPYGGFASDSSRWPWRDGLLKEQHWWRRQLDWVSHDDRLFDFTLFLEQHLFAHLTSLVTGRYMVVLEKRPDTEANRAWLAAKNELNRHMAATIDAALLSRVLPGEWADWRRTLNGLLDYPRSRVLFGFLVQALGARGVPLVLTELLDDRHLVALRDWIGQESVDAQAMIMATDWHACPAFADALTLCDVNMGVGLEYSLMRRLLRDYFEVNRAEDKA